MSESGGMSIRLLDKEYRVSCPPEEQDALTVSASYLGKKMKEIRDSGKVVGTDRIAVMAALNITHELLKIRTDNVSLNDNFGSRIRSIQNKIDAALHDSKQIDL
jgi:cell division protein ZapA